MSIKESDVFGLPTRRLCQGRVVAGTATALERFVYRHEPLRPGVAYMPDEEFRRDLQALIAEIEGPPVSGRLAMKKSPQHK